MPAESTTVPEDVQKFEGLTAASDGGERFEDQQPDDATLSPEDRDALASKLASKLDDLDSDDPDGFDDSDGSTDATSDEATDGDDDGQTTAGEGSEGGEKDGDEGDASDDSSEGDQQTDQGAAADGAPTLPDAYRRSLHAYGWKDEEIDQNLEALGERFIDTAARIHTNRNQELTSWADAGRKAREQRQSAPASQGQAQPSTNQPPEGLQPVDIAKLKEKYGEDEEELVELASRVNATVEQVRQILPQVQQAQRVVQQAEVDALVREIDTFFRDDSLKPFTDRYGDGQASLTDEQRQNRDAVLDLADAMIEGAQLQGRELSVQQALTYAHDSLTADQQASAVREAVKQEAKRRNRGISQRPSNRGSQQSRGPAVKTRSDLETATQDRLRAAFS